MYDTSKQEGSVSVIVAVVFVVLFFVASGFGVWAFLGRQDYKNNVDEKVSAAVEVAVEEAEEKKETEFIEREKLPTRTFNGSATYGSISFEYPKTWSVYTEEGTSGTVLDIYAHPASVPGLRSKQPYALRVEVLSNSYDTEIKSVSSSVERGELTAKAFSLEKVTGVLGLRADGLIDRDVTGAAVYLPLRDKTIKVSSEAPQFINDFNTIILPSLVFVP